MKHEFQGWDAVAKRLEEFSQDNALLNEGQGRSLRVIAERIPENGLVLADEVGMGKTRIACVLARAVIESGGRVAVLVPPGLGYQWRQELKEAGVEEVPELLRSLQKYFEAWAGNAPPKPWFNEKCLIVSHAFSNWRLGEKSEAWRYELLPEILPHLRKSDACGFCGNDHSNHSPSDQRVAAVKKATQSIVEMIEGSAEDHHIRSIADDLIGSVTRTDELFNSTAYTRNGSLRAPLERTVGLGLGVLDLVITDEAHKSRRHESGVSRLLSNVILQSSSTRRFAMTATPVELGVEQWQSMFERIGLDDPTKNKQTIDEYAKAVANVRAIPLDESAQERFRKAARAFEGALSPFLLRRDKREEASVKNFVKYTCKGHDDYRDRRRILVSVEHLTHKWKQAVCAAEALSFVARRTDGKAAHAAKRVRLTLGNGHGISALIDQTQHEEEERKRKLVDSGSQPGADPVGTAFQSKQDQRLTWWRELLQAPFTHSTPGTAPPTQSAKTVPYDHPAILAAIQAIEAVALHTDGRAAEKVLVFGRFTRPMLTLVHLLNARQMLRALDAGKPWPQQKIYEEEWPAIEAAHGQLKRPGEIDRTNIDKRLSNKYTELEETRREFRESLLDRLDEGFKYEGSSPLAQRLFEAFKKKAANGASGNESTLVVIARALADHLVDVADAVDQQKLVEAFSELTLAAGDRDLENQSELDSSWSDIEERIREEYAHAQSGFARLLHGESKPSTRRLLQLAFNRPHSSPQVLVAQSLVGREGLNLHKACRTVVLLHPEWNPGVVEQQIGRVDRLGSLWEQHSADHINRKGCPDEMPRIEFRPIVFQGTYDEYNWQVLDARWEELRAQLHGVILTTTDGGLDRAVIDKVNDYAPSFSPAKDKREKPQISAYAPNGKAGS